MTRVSARRTRILCGLGLVLVAWLGPAALPARAATVVVSLKYAAAPGCPDATDFKAAVIARLGYDPFSEEAPDHVLVQIRPRGASLDGHIEWRDAQGQWTGDQRFPQRRPNCLHLVRAMAFALALQIQFLAKADAPPAVAAPVTEKPAPNEPTPPPPPPAYAPPAVIAPTLEPPAVPVVAAPLPMRHARPVFAVGTGPAVGWGMSSSPVVLGRVFGAAGWQRLSLELALVMSVPSMTRRSDGAGFSQQYLFLSAGSCGTLSRWKACLLVNAGQVRLQGRDIDRPASAAVPLLEVGARVGVVQGIGRRVFLDAHVDGVALLTRWIGRLDEVPVWSAPPFAATIGVDAGVRFP